MALLLTSSVALANPFLVSDPVTTADGSTPNFTRITCVYSEGFFNPVITPLVNNGCKIDLANFSTGEHTLQVWFRYTDFGQSTDGARASITFTLPPPPLCHSAATLYVGTFGVPCEGPSTCWAQSSVAGMVNAAVYDWPGWWVQCTQDQPQLVEPTCLAGLDLYLGLFNLPCPGPYTCWGRDAIAGAVDATPYGWPGWYGQCVQEQPQMQ